MSKEALDLPPVLAEPRRHSARHIPAVVGVFRRYQLDRILVVPIAFALMILLATLLQPNNDGGSDPCAGQTSSSCSP